jgi:O-antigen ligase
VFLDIAGIVLSASRGSLLAALLSLGVVWLLCSSVRAKTMTAVAVVMLGSILSAVPDKDALFSKNAALSRLTTTTVDLDNPEAAQRRGLWTAAVDEFLKSPILGCGRGNFGVALHGGLMYAHNTYLGLLAELGLAGFLTYLAFGAQALFVLIRGLTASKEYKVATAMLLAGVLAVALAGITINIENYRGIWMLMAVVECFRRLYLTMDSHDRSVA